MESLYYLGVSCNRQRFGYGYQCLHKQSRMPDCFRRVQRRFDISGLAIDRSKATQHEVAVIASLQGFPPP